MLSENSEVLPGIETLNTLRQEPTCWTPQLAQVYIEQETEAHVLQNSTGFVKLFHSLPTELVWLSDVNQHLKLRPNHCRFKSVYQPKRIRNLFAAFKFMFFKSTPWNKLKSCLELLFHPKLLAINYSLKKV